LTFNIFTSWVQGEALVEFFGYGFNDRQVQPHRGGDQGTLPVSGMAHAGDCHTLRLKESGYGTKLPIWNVRYPVANGGKADNICS
jgi:hypothetical protein